MLIKCNCLEDIAIKLVMVVIVIIDITKDLFTNTCCYYGPFVSNSYGCYDHKSIIILITNNLFYYIINIILLIYNKLLL